MAITLLLLVCAAASAQDTVPPPEVGAGYGGLLVNRKGGDYTVGASRPAVDVRMTLPFTPRFAFEGLATISSSTSTSRLHITNAVYLLQVKQRLRSMTGERFHAFLTYGAAGYYAHLHQEAVTSIRPDGTPSSIGEFTFAHTDPPFFAVLDGGLQRELGRRAAFRADVQVITLAWAPFGVRASTGLSARLGE